MIVCVTGTPGTGKTKFAKELARKLKIKYLDVKKVIKKYKLEEEFDEQRKCCIVDENKLSNVLKHLIKKEKNLIIDSHLSHYLPKKYVDICVVTNCDIKILKKRLEKRGYSKEKIRENLDAEIFDVCYVEAKDIGHNVVRVDTSKKNIKKLVKEFIENYIKKK